MKTLTLSEAKMKLSALIASINLTEEEVLIIKNGTSAAVLVSPKEYASWNETLTIKADEELNANSKQPYR
jgi:prevent-host-death family protein